jgi:hypothetical protein
MNIQRTILAKREILRFILDQTERFLSEININFVFWKKIYLHQNRTDITPNGLKVTQSTPLLS